MATNRVGTLRRLMTAGFVLAGLLMLASLTVYTLPRFGWRVDGLRSGSMSPLMNAGDLVLTRPVAPGDIAVGDIIVFRIPNRPNNLVSHRVIGLGQGPSPSFTTKGDANDSPDPFVISARDVVGIVDLSLPWLGYLALFLKTGLGLVAGLVVPGTITAYASLKGIRNEMTRSALAGRDA